MQVALKNNPQVILGDEIDREVQAMDDEIVKSADPHETAKSIQATYSCLRAAASNVLGYSEREFMSRIEDAETQTDTFLFLIVVKMWGPSDSRP